MRAAGALALAVMWGNGALASASGAVSIPDTRWTIHEEDGWTPDQRHALRELAGRLPADYRDPGVPVEISLSEAAPLADSRGHTFGKIQANKPHITLFARDLEARLAEADLTARLGGDPAAVHAAALLLLERVLVHELTHLVDRRAKLSTQKSWRALSGWAWWSRVLTPYTPYALGDFASPWGALSPAEDLATFAEIYFVPPALGPFDAEIAPRCRFPAKYRYLSEQLGPHPDPTPAVRCSGAADAGLSAERVGEIDILLATPTLSRVASMSGHLLLAVEIRDGAASRWDTFSLVANTGAGDDSSMETILNGLVGGYPSQIDRRPYESTRIRYVEGENRDILRFRWVLSDDEKAALLARLDDMSLHWRRPYLFLQRNCSALVIELAAAVEEERLRSPFVVPPDMVLAELARRGRIVPIAPDPSRDLAPTTRARLLAAASEDAADAACGGPYPEAGSERAARRDEMYAAMLAAASSGSDERCWTALARAMAFAAPLDRALAARVEAAPMPGRDEALAALQSRLPAAERASLHQEADQRSAEVYAARQPRGAASTSTPYSPLTIGVLVRPSDGAVAPMLALHRAALELVAGQPRLFPPAHGLDLRALDALVAISPTAHPDPVAQLDLLRFTYQPEPMLPHPTPLLRLGLLSTTVASTLSDRSALAWARWADAAFGATLLRAADQRRYLDATLGLDIRSALSFSPGTARGSTWFAAPLTLHGAAFRDARLQLGLEARVAGLPALGADGAPTLALAAEGSGWIYLGHLGDQSVKLALSGRDSETLRGDMALPPAELSLGLRLERR